MKFCISAMICLFVTIIVLSEAQVFRGNRRLGIGGLRNNRGLSAADRRALSRQQRLNNQRRGRARIGANNLRNARRNQAARVGTGNRLRAGNNIRAQEVGSAARFNNFDASYNRAQSNKLQLALNAENSFSEGAAIKSSSGNAIRQGSQLAVDQDLFADDFFNGESLLDDQVQQQNQLEAEGLTDNNFNIGTGLNSLSDRRLAANDEFDGGFNSFGNSVFGKK